MKRLLLLSVIMIAISAAAQTTGKKTYEEDGITYTIYSATVGGKTTRIAEVTEYNSPSDMSLVDVKIPETILFDLTDKTSVIVPVLRIGKKAFYQCLNITSVTMSSITSIEDSAFAFCQRMEKVTFKGKSSTDLKKIGVFSFGWCTGLTSLSLPSGITDLPDRAFFRCSALKSVDLPESLVSMGYGPFGYCGNLQSVTFHNSLETIGDDAFYYCKALSSVQLPNSLKSIKHGAFATCGLESINIPASVTEIGYSVFVDNPNLQSIIVEEGNEVYDSRDNCNAIIETARNKLINGCRNTEIPNSVVTIDSNAFQGATGLTSIMIPRSVTIIGGGVFLNCPYLTTVIVNWNSLKDAQWGDSSDYSKCILIVPAGTKKAYEQAEPFKNFKMIFEVASSVDEDVNRDGDVNGLDALKVYKYMQSH